MTAPSSSATAPRNSDELCATAIAATVARNKNSLLKITAFFMGV
jgi:hypothetical protein